MPFEKSTDEMLSRSKLYYPGLTKERAEGFINANKGANVAFIRPSSQVNRLALTSMDEKFIIHHTQILVREGPGGVQFSFEPKPGEQPIYHNTLEDLVREIGFTMFQLSPTTAADASATVYIGAPTLPDLSPDEQLYTPIAAKPELPTIQSWILNSHVLCHDISDTKAAEQLSAKKIKPNTGLFRADPETGTITLTYLDSNKNIREVADIKLDEQGKPSIGNQKYDSFKHLASHYHIERLLNSSEHQKNFVTSKKDLGKSLDKNGLYLPKASQKESALKLADTKKQYIIRNSESVPGLQVMTYYDSDKNVQQALVHYDSKNKTWSCRSSDKNKNEVVSFSKSDDMAKYISKVTNPNLIPEAPTKSGIFARLKAMFGDVSSAQQPVAASQQQTPKTGKNS